MQPRISDVLTRDVVVVRPDESVQRAAQLMAQLNVGSLPVHDGQRLCGIVTDRDITVRAIAQGLLPDSTTIDQVMSTQVLSCEEGHTVDEVMEQMAEAQVRRLPVLNSAREVIGIVSLGDLATRQPRPVDEALRGISSH